MPRPARAAIALALAISASGAAAQHIRFARYPHASDDGRIAFSYHGDIWVARADGSQPRRLSAHIARDTFPRFSPDGRWIAFNSDRMGNPDVWIVAASGGVPRQLTFHSTGDSVQYWTPDGKGVVIATSRGANPWGSPLYIAPLDGRRPTPLPMDRGAAGMIRQDGKLIAFNRLGLRYWRKHYRGNNNTDVWVQDLTTRKIRQLTDTNPRAFRSHVQDAYPMWGADGKIYFLSERGGSFNLWRIDPAGGEPEQVTRHEGDGVQFPSISPAGRTIVYEQGFELWALSVPDGTPRRITLELAFDPKENAIHYLDAEGKAEGFSPSPDGKRIALDFHGEIVIAPADPDKGEKIRVTDSPWRDRYERWSPDGKTIAYVSDASLEEEIWLYDVESGERRKLTAQESIKRSMRWAPSGKQLAFAASNRIYLADIASSEVRELAHNPEGGFSLGSFSSDGRWLSYSRSNENLNSEVYLLRIADRREFNLTQHLARERAGELTPDGKRLVFTSDREGGTSQLFTVTLVRMSADPDDPLVKQQRAEEVERGKKSSKKKDKEDAAEKEPAEKVLELAIDLEEIDRRARQLTRGEESVGGFFLDSRGKTIYFTRGRALYSISIDGGDEKKIAEGSFRSMRPSADRKKLFFSDGGAISWITLSSKKKETLKFDFRVRVDQRAEWKQVFEEAWRVMKYRFYDAGMHGFDWNAIKARYEPLLASVGENQDLYDLCNEMIGELNASHTGVSGPPTRAMERLYSTRSLGFEVEPGEERYRIAHIYRDGPADKEWLGLHPGDELRAINGVDIRSGDNYFPLLNDLLNDYVAIEVASPGEEPRTVRIHAAASLRSIKYEEWVHRCREFVDQRSKGKIGYVHIRSMSRGPLRRFENEINQYWNKHGMIIDIRYNGGGNIDQELIDILERRPYEYWNRRDGGRAWGRRPRQAIAGPKVMLINWRSASDSEVTPQGFRDLKLGRIVGTPTYGAVIATGSYRLLSGARIRTPGSLVTTYDPTRPNNYGINLENFGVAPDVWAENTPADELAGFDRELAAAVDEALRMLKEGTWQYGEDR